MVFEKENWSYSVRSIRSGRDVYIAIPGIGEGVDAGGRREDMCFMMFVVYLKVIQCLL